MHDIFLAVIDDHKLVRDGIEASLALHAKYKVKQFSSGGDFISSTRDTGMLPDLVLLDFNMPVLTGIDTLEQSMKRWPSLKVVMVSNEENVNIVGKSMGVGAKGYLFKGECSGRFLNESIKTVISGRNSFTTRAQAVINSFVSSGQEEMICPKNKLGLRTREVQILKLIAGGLQNKEIATELAIAVSSIRRYRREAMIKAGVHNVLEISRFVNTHNF